MNTLRIRMYRQGLGDCFLITKFSGDKRLGHILMDCGVVLGTRDASKVMNDVVQDIAKETNNRLDLLVVTHEHWDHLSGFIQAQSLFDSMKIENMWVAWTENPTNDLANTLRRQRAAKHRGLKLALKKLPSTGFKDFKSAVERVLDFMGSPAPLGATKGTNTTGAALEYLKNKVGKNITYCSPGQVKELGSFKGQRFYILGPPEDEKSIKKDLPSKKDSEVYQFARRLSFEESFFVAVNAFNETEGTDEHVKFNQPFDSQFRIPISLAPDYTSFAEYFNPKYEWRKIDYDWLTHAGELALQLDSDTNNTSLVLAIEDVKTGKVLLFPGDAQVGNWLSWDNVNWSVTDKNGNTQQVTSKDLLARTSFYKVSHHGSHNATLREKGLEEMTSQDLVAMIPVDHKMAVKKGWAKMPFPSLLKRIDEKTRGRFVRIDDKALNIPGTNAGLSQAELTTYKNALKMKRLYVDFVVEV
jgi:hypothetical protein